jgi:hypothetical protein
MTTKIKPILVIKLRKFSDTASTRAPFFLNQDVGEYLYSKYNLGQAEHSYLYHKRDKLSG